MSKKQYIEPTIAVEADSTITHNVVSSTDGGAMQVVTTEQTVVTHEADRHIVAGDMLVGPGHFKTVPTDLYVTGDIKVDAKDAITIGDDTIRYNGLLEVNGILASGGDIDVLGDLVFTDDPVIDDGIKAGSENEIGWLPIEGGEFSGAFYKEITFTTPFSDANYAITVQAIEYFDAGFLTAIEKKPTGFKIATSITPTSAPDTVDWMAIKY